MEVEQDLVSKFEALMNLKLYDIFEKVLQDEIA